MPVRKTSKIFFRRSPWLAHCISIFLWIYGDLAFELFIIFRIQRWALLQLITLLVAFSINRKTTIDILLFVCRFRCVSTVFPDNNPNK